MKARLSLAVLAGLLLASPQGRSALARLRAAVRPTPAPPPVPLPPAAPLGRASTGTDVAVDMLMGGTD